MSSMNAEAKRWFDEHKQQKLAAEAKLENGKNLLSNEHKYIPLADLMNHERVKMMTACELHEIVERIWQFVEQNCQSKSLMHHLPNSERGFSSLECRQIGPYYHFIVSGGKEIVKVLYVRFENGGRKMRIGRNQTGGKYQEIGCLLYEQDSEYFNVENRSGSFCYCMNIVERLIAVAEEERRT